MKNKSFEIYNAALENERAYELHNGDVLYCNTVLMEKLGYYYELDLGKTIYIHSENNNILEEGIEAQVIEVIKEKKYPDKRWWQFWIKQEETITGYRIMII